MLALRCERQEIHETENTQINETIEVAQLLLMFGTKPPSKMTAASTAKHNSPFITFSQEGMFNFHIT